jgi:lipid-binding SYLF domain-containing protein
MEYSHMKPTIRSAVMALAGAMALIAPLYSFADSAHEIDARVDVALQRFESEVAGAKNLLAQAKGVLVLPKVLKGGFVVGGEYGEGALRINGRSIGYYSVASVSLGFTFGGEEKDLILVFLDEGALGKFRSSEGWQAGVDGNIAVMDKGAGASLDTTKLNAPIVGFVVGVKGLLVDASFKGSKFTPLKK